MLSLELCFKVGVGVVGGVVVGVVVSVVVGGVVGVAF